MKLQLTFCVALDRYMKDLEYIFTAHSDGIRVEGHPGGFLGRIILFCLLLVFYISFVHWTLLPATLDYVYI